MNFCCSLFHLRNETQIHEQRSHQNMRLKVGSNGELKVEGCAKLRQSENFTPINPEDDDCQTWFIETKMGNKLTLPAVGGTPPDSSIPHFIYTILDTDLLSNDKKEDIKKNCPIACGMFYTHTHVYDFVRSKWIKKGAAWDHISLFMAFRSIQLRLIVKLEEYDRECEMEKCLSTLAKR